MLDKIAQMEEFVRSDVSGDTLVFCYDFDSSLVVSVCEPQPTILNALALMNLQQDIQVSELTANVFVSETFPVSFVVVTNSIDDSFVLLSDLVSTWLHRNEDNPLNDDCAKRIVSIVKQISTK